MNTFRATILALIALISIFYYYNTQSSTEQKLAHGQRAAVPVSNSTSSTPPVTINAETLIYWGRDILSTEPSLATICQQTPHEIIIIAWIRKHFSSPYNIPGLDFSDHCTVTMFSSEAFGTDFFPLLCPSIGQDILTCQGLGKKVLISLSPMDALESEDDATLSANNIWNLFLGGSVPSGAGYQRPFGNGVVLDGLDVMLRGNDYLMYLSFMQELTQLASDQTDKQYLFSASPRCSFPDALLGPVYKGSIFETQPSLFNIIILNGMSCTDCTFLHADIMYSTIGKWMEWISQTPNLNLNLYIALVAGDAYLDDAPGDYIPGDQVTTFNTQVEAQSTLYSSSSWTIFKGYAVYEGSAEMSPAMQPCSNDAELIAEGQLSRVRRYGDLLRSAFEGQTIDCVVSNSTYGNENSTTSNIPEVTRYNGTLTDDGQEMKPLNFQLMFVMLVFVFVTLSILF